MSGELQPSLGDIRPHGHLKIGRFTQHFVDVLNLEQTPLDFFDTVYPGTPREEQRKYLGRIVCLALAITLTVGLTHMSQSTATAQLGYGEYRCVSQGCE